MSLKLKDICAPSLGEFEKDKMIFWRRRVSPSANLLEVINCRREMATIDGYLVISQARESRWKRTTGRNIFYYRNLNNNGWAAKQARESYLSLA